MRSSSTARPGISAIASWVAAIPARVSSSSRSPCTEASRLAASSEPPSRALGLVVSTRLTQRSTIASSIRPPPPRWSIAAWVRLPTILWVEETTTSAPQLERVGGQVGVEAQVGPPGLVDRQRHAALVRDLGEAGDVGAGAEVGGRDDHRRDRPRRRVERRRQRVRRQAVGDAQVRVELGGGEARPHAAEDEAVDRRGVDVALDDDLGAVVRQRQADRVVALRGAVDQEPAALRAPGAGGEILRLLEGGRLGADVDPLGDRGDVVAQADLADQLAHRRVGAGAALVAGDLEAAGVAGRVGEQRVDVGGRVLALARHRIESTPPTALRRHLRRWSTRPTATGWRRPGRSSRRAPLERRARAPTWSSSAAATPGCGRPGTRRRSSPRRAWSCSRRTSSAAAGRAAATAASATRCGSRCRTCGERWGAEGALAVARAAEDAVAGIGEFCEAEGVDAWFRRGGYLKVSTAEAFDDVDLRGGRRLPRAGRGRRGAGAEPERGRRALRTRRPSAAASSSPTRRRCSRPGSRSACASGCWRPGSRSSSPRRCRA